MQQHAAALVDEQRAAVAVDRQQQAAVWAQAQRGDLSEACK